MEQYITQLLEEMLAAHNLLTKNVDDDEQTSDDDDNEDIEAHFAEVERYLSGEGRQEIGDLIGFYPEQFPPVEKLNDGQMKRVNVGFRVLMRSHNVEFSIPEELPVAIEYHLLAGSLKRDVYVPLDGYRGTDNIEFCSYDVESCPFGSEFCQCKDVKFDDMDDFETNNDEMPF